MFDIRNRRIEWINGDVPDSIEIFVISVSTIILKSAWLAILLIGVYYSGNLDFFSNAGHTDLQGNIPSQIFLLICAAPMEEVMFRVIPFLIFLILEKILNLKYFAKAILLLSIIVLSEVIFGMAHGSINNILIQGVFGLGYWLIFLFIIKPFSSNEADDSSGSSIDRDSSSDRITLAFSVSSVTHFSYNFIVLFLSKI